LINRLGLRLAEQIATERREMQDGIKSLDIGSLCTRLETSRMALRGRAAREPYPTRLCLSQACRPREQERLSSIAHARGFHALRHVRPFRTVRDTLKPNFAPPRENASGAKHPASGILRLANNSFQRNAARFNFRKLPRFLVNKRGDDGSYAKDLPAIRHHFGVKEETLMFVLLV
jgi:hypothetical protein